MIERVVLRICFYFDKRLEKYYIAARPGIEVYYTEREQEEEQA